MAQEAESSPEPLVPAPEAAEREAARKGLRAAPPDLPGEPQLLPMHSAQAIERRWPG
jgi:hypothetical protein